MVLIKVADISNEARPMEVAEPWLDKLLQVCLFLSDFRVADEGTQGPPPSEIVFVLYIYLFAVRNNFLLDTHLILMIIIYKVLQDKCKTHKELVPFFMKQEKNVQLRYCKFEQHLF